MLQWGTRYRRPRDFNSAYHAPNVRRTAAAEQVCLDFEDNNWEILEALDIFLFPPDWRERLDELQEALPHTDPDFMRNIARDAIPLPWKRTVPRIVHDLCPVTLEEIKIGDDLIAIDADGVSRTLGVFESGRFAFADTQEQSTYSGKYVKVDWRNTEESGNRFRLNTVYLHECGLAEWEWKDPADQSRTFRWTKEVEDYLTDIVRRNAFDEYMEIINRPKKVSATDCVSTEIPACSSGCGGTSNERAEWAQVTSAKSLMARFGDPRRKLATRLMAARSARLANEAETSGVNGDELETPIS